MSGGGTARFTNDTIANNSTGGGGGGIDTCGNNFCGATANLNAVTIARNTAGGSGGGIYEEYGVINVRNSLIALNQAGPFVGPDCDRADPAGVVSQGHNLIGDTTDCSGAFGSATHDITDVDPKIGKLADNGGPTKTIALLKGSPAINHGGPDAEKRDQRGVLRGAKPDIGAYERR